MHVLNLFLPPMAAALVVTPTSLEKRVSNPRLGILMTQCYGQTAEQRVIIL